MSTGNAMIEGVTTMMMQPEFLVWRCLHGGHPACPWVK